jgi:hypothetical protein
MGWGSVPDWVSAVANLTIALAAAIAAWQGVKSLTAWRREAVGRRRIELAEEILADFYEARDHFSWVRSPGGFGSESEGRPGREEEDEDVRKDLDMYYRPIKRLSDFADFFAKVSTRRYRVIAAFGADRAKPYDELNAIHARITSAAHMLMMMHRRVRPVTKHSQEQAEKFHHVIWEGYPPDAPDEIKAQLDELVAAVERNFRGEITEAGT